MIYDRLAETVEKHFPQWRDAVQDARLFVMERSDNPGERASTEQLRMWRPEEAVIENFRLPFSSVAVEQARACGVVHTIDSDKRRYLILVYSESNVGGDDLFCSADVIAFPDSESLDPAQVGRVCSGVKSLQVFRMQRGRCEEVFFEQTEIELDMHGGHDPDIPPIPPLESLTRQEALDLKAELAVSVIPYLDQIRDVRQANIAWLEIICAICCLLTVCEPSTFVVEETPLSFKEREPKPGKVIRSPYRPHYIVLKPGEIKKRYLYDERDEATGLIPRAPHERRGHFRRLTSERFTAKRGHVIWIKPCWAGKTEGVRGKNKYRVLLDV
jgi:hypothetical protein